MSRHDPSAADGEVATRDLGRCTCTHIEGVHMPATSWQGNRGSCSAAWVGTDGRVWIRCDCRHYTPEEDTP